MEILAEVARSSVQTLPRIHAIWGLGTGRSVLIADRRNRLWDAIGGLLADPDPEVRAQTAKVVGEATEARAFDRLIGAARRREPAGPLLRRGGPGQVGPLRGDRTSLGDDSRQRRQRSLPASRWCHGAGRIRQDRGVESGRARRVAQARMAILLAMRGCEDPQIARFLSRRRPADCARGRAGDP